MLNTWLPAQTRMSRILGRTGFYQGGGAIGFRDQLQDMLSLIGQDDEAVRRHLLLCAAHQFPEGDVQHWWHPPRMGVRTRISDDMLFLPYVAAEYLRLTGDVALLEDTAMVVRSELAAPGKVRYLFRRVFIPLARRNWTRMGQKQPHAAGSTHPRG